MHTAVPCCGFAHAVVFSPPIQARKESRWMTAGGLDYHQMILNSGQGRLSLLGQCGLCKTSHGRPQSSQLAMKKTRVYSVNAACVGANESIVRKEVEASADPLGVLDVEHMSEPHKEHVLYRLREYNARNESFEKYQGGLEDFSSGYRKFGSTREKDAIVYRKWVPSATSNGSAVVKGTDREVLEDTVQGGGSMLQGAAGEHQVNGSFTRIGFVAGCVTVGLWSMIDSRSAAAVEVDAMASPHPLLPAEMLLRLVSILGDLDPGTAQLATSLAGPFITIFNALFIFRIVMSWYPGIPVKKFPFFLAYNPTEPVLGPTRRLIPPVGGVDVAPVIWVAIMSFANEILLGKQGLLVLLSQQQS